MIRSKFDITLKLLSLFAVVRGYNLIVLIIAQYLCSIYIFSPDKVALKTLSDPTLFVLVLASTITVASGFIINSFYDAGKDFINRPISFGLEQYVNQSIKLPVYFGLNFLTILLAASISFRAVLFFMCYIFAIWVYSHSLKKMLFVGNIISPILVIMPFFAVFLYYKNESAFIFTSALFLFFLLMLKNLVKDLENLKGDFVFNYRTIAVIYGEKTSKAVISFVMAIAGVISGFLVFDPETGKMRYLLYLLAPMLLMITFFLWIANKKTHYTLLHYVIKALILLGVFGIPLFR